MTFGNTRRPFGGTFTAQQIRAERPMLYIRCGTVAMYSGCIAKEYTYVVEHGGSLYLRGVKRKLTARGNFERELRHRAGMAHINIPKGRAFGIIFINNPLRIK